MVMLHDPRLTAAGEKYSRKKGEGYIRYNVKTLHRDGRLLDLPAVRRVKKRESGGMDLAKQALKMCRSFC
jgi:hypothetical protein